MKNLVTIKTFKTRLEAEIVKGMLNAHNIDSLVSADDEGGMYPFPLQPANTGVQLLISKKDILKVKKLLKER